MKISRISIKMLILALVFYLAWYYAGISSRKYEVEKEQEAREKYGYIILHGQEELNYWDYTGIGFMILAISSTVVAVWVKKFDD
ncbi:MAG: hypothetical protein M3388_15900 [Acidobacteriota bacterium]|nr:hypothetical protein [Acidobacteriota bacterium]